MKGEEEYFETTSGVRQGGPESPNLFNLYLDYIMRIYNNHAKLMGIGVTFEFRIKDQAITGSDRFEYRGQGEYPWLGYADDLVLTATSPADLQRAADLLSSLLSKFGLVINIPKTKTMILNYEGHQYPDTIVKVDGKPIENVKEFVYLGTLLNYSNPGTSDHEIDRRIGMATSKFAEMKKLLCNYRINISTRVRFYEVYIRSRLCYSCGTWTLTQKQYSRVEAAHIGFLRRLVRGGMQRKSSANEIKVARTKAKHGASSDFDNIDWSWKHNNNSILNIAQTATIESFVKNQNMKWIAHVVRSSNDNFTKQLMFPNEKYKKKGCHQKTVYEHVIKDQELLGKSAESFLRECLNRFY